MKKKTTYTSFQFRGINDPQKLGFVKKHFLSPLLVQNINFDLLVEVPIPLTRKDYFGRMVDQIFSNFSSRLTSYQRDKEDKKDVIFQKSRKGELILKKKSSSNLVKLLNSKFSTKNEIKPHHNKSLNSQFLLNQLPVYSYAKAKKETAIERESRRGPASKIQNGRSSAKTVQTKPSISGIGNACTKLDKYKPKKISKDAISYSNLKSRRRKSSTSLSQKLTLNLKKCKSQKSLQAQKDVFSSKQMSFNFKNPFGSFLSDRSRLRGIDSFFLQNRGRKKMIIRNYKSMDKKKKEQINSILNQYIPNKENVYRVPQPAAFKRNFLKIIK